MRKWTYLVAALLMSGTAATFTSCIDNEEPAGIEAMRTAKAEFYSAQAALKLAEVEYENAKTQLKLQEVEKEKYMNEALRLQNELLAAENENEKKKLALELAEAEKQHEIAMQVYETTLKEAEAAYQVALKNFDIAMANINSAYTAEYARILASITSNRAEYKKISAEITDKELTLMQFAEETLDTASVRGKLDRNVEKLTAELDLMKNELDLLKTINNADAEGQNKIIADLDKEIREKVEDFNADVAKYNKLSTDKTAATTAKNEKATALGEENKTKFEVDAEATLTVAPEIQHTFISSALSSGIVDNTFIEDNVNTELIGLDEYYTFKATDNLFKLKYTKDDINTISVSDNPTYELSNDISTISNYLSSFSENDYQEKVAKKQLYNDILDSYKTKYEKQLEEFEKEGGTRDIYLEKLAAYTMYKQGSDKDVYYNYINDYKTNVYDEAIIAANAITDATEKAAAIKAAQDAFIAELKAYGKARFELDGWFYPDPADVTNKTKFYETIESAEVDGNWRNILGINTLDKTNEGSPYYNFLTEGEKLFGSATGFGDQYLDPNGEAYTKPDIETEYKKYLIDSSNKYTGGMFGDYLQAYIDAKAVAIAEAQKVLVDEIEKINASLTVKKLEFAVLEEDVLENAEYLALVENEKNIQKQIDDLKVQIGTNPDDISVKLNYADVDAAAGTYDRITSLDFVKADGTTVTPVTPDGYKGDYLVSLKVYHNGLRSGVSGYEKQLADLQAKYDAKEAEKVTAEQLLAEFDKGGYEVYDKKENDAEKTEEVDYVIPIGGEYGGYITYTLIPDESGETTTIVETTSYYDNELKQWVDYKKTTTIPSSELGYIAGIITDKDDAPIMGGSTEGFQVTTHFLKVVIEAYNAEIEILKAQLLDLDAEHEILKKELAAFLDVLNERYPEAAAQ